MTAADVGAKRHTDHSIVSHTGDLCYGLCLVQIAIGFSLYTQNR